MSVYVHGDNILQKENHPSKYRDETSKQYLVEIRAKYEEWKAANLEISGPIREYKENDEVTVAEELDCLMSTKIFWISSIMLNTLILVLIYIHLLWKSSCISCLKI